MNLYLIESSCHGVERALLEQRLQAVETHAELLEAQASAQDNRLYVVLLAADERAAREAFAHSGLQAELVKQVRLVGQDWRPYASAKRERTTSWSGTCPRG